MTGPLTIRLIAAGAGDHRARRKVLVERMAKDLVRFEAHAHEADAIHAHEADAIRSLFGRGYAMADIVMLVDDARQVAMQDVVAREMAKP